MVDTHHHGIIAISVQTFISAVYTHSGQPIVSRSLHRYCSTKSEAVCSIGGSLSTSFFSSSGIRFVSRTSLLQWCPQLNATISLWASPSNDIRTEEFPVVSWDCVLVWSRSEVNASFEICIIFWFVRSAGVPCDWVRLAEELVIAPGKTRSTYCSRILDFVRSTFCIARCSIWSRKLTSNLSAIVWNVSPGSPRTSTKNIGKAKRDSNSTTSSCSDFTATKWTFQQFRTSSHNTTKASVSVSTCKTTYWRTTRSIKSSSDVSDRSFAAAINFRWYARACW